MSDSTNFSIPVARLQAGERTSSDIPSLRVVAIPAGWFEMGCHTGRDDEKPVHRVWVDAFEIGVCQVTRAEYTHFLKATGTAAPAFWDEVSFQDPSQPAAGPSWFDAAAFCAWLTRSDGRAYRLPTEAEWERAARGNADGLLYPWGDAATEAVPDYASRWKSGPERVAMYGANPFGLFNMGDNVHEWCADWYDAGYYQISPERNPQGPESGVRRASRGGSWRHHVKVSRCAARSSIPPEFHYADYGFRVAL